VGSFVVLRTGRASSIDGTEIAFSDWGNAKGAPVVLIHGWLFSRQAFARQMQGELAERCRVVAYDLRGHGESGKPESLSDYSDGRVWAADLECVLAAVGTSPTGTGTVGTERPVLAGWSLGGRVAAHYVFVKGPERVAGLNLVAARILQPANISAKGESSGAPTTAAPPGQSIEATARFVRNCTNSPFSEEDGELFLGTAMAVPPVAQQGASAWHMDYGSFFDELELPTLVTHGANDPLTLPLAAENIARRLHGKLSIYPECGHMPFWEEPARFNHELAEFAERAAVPKW
jgi:pimeloyl-ACP methyl ester carboxylesterase